MKTARNCALILTVFSCASGMRYVSDDEYSAHVAINIDRLMGHSPVVALAAPGSWRERHTWQVQPMAAWLNVSLDERQRVDPMLAGLDRAMSAPAQLIAPGFERKLGGTSFGVNSHLTDVSLGL